MAHSALNFPPLPQFMSSSPHDLSHIMVTGTRCPQEIFAAWILNEETVVKHTVHSLKKVPSERGLSVFSQASSAAATPEYCLVVHSASSSELLAMSDWGLGLFRKGVAPEKRYQALGEWMKHLTFACILPLVLCVALSLAWSSSRNLAWWCYLFKSKLQQRIKTHLLFEHAHCRTRWELLHLPFPRSAKLEKERQWSFEVCMEQRRFLNCLACSRFKYLSDTSTWHRHCGQRETSSQRAHCRPVWSLNTLGRLRLQECLRERGFEGFCWQNDLGISVSSFTEWSAAGLCLGLNEAPAATANREKPQRPDRPGTCLVCVVSSGLWLLIGCFCVPFSMQNSKCTRNLLSRQTSLGYEIPPDREMSFI